MVQLGVINPESRTSIPLHFIAHSFGSAVTTEAIERLAQFDITVDQVTLLDPHDMDQSGIPIDESQAQYTLGLPQPIAAGQPGSELNYGATLWNNVRFADVYYQTTTIPLVPDGRPIPGAYNLTLEPGGVNPHSTIWSSAYQSTITNPNSQAWGYRFSRLVNPTLTAAELDNLRPDPVFFNGQDHKLTSLGLVVNGLPVISTTAQADITDARYAPLWNIYSIENGDFSGPGDEIQRTVGTTAMNIVPGWSHHGGGGTARVKQVGSNYVLEFSATGNSRVHNSFYVPEGAGGISFALSRTTASVDDVLQVALDNTVLASLPLTTVGTGRVSVEIPAELRGAVRTMRLNLLKGGAGIEAVVNVDNFRFDVGGNSGDVFRSILQLCSQAPLMN